MIEESTGSKLLGRLYEGGMTGVDIAAQLLATGGTASIKSLAKGLGAVAKALGDDFVKAFIKTYGDDAVRALTTYGDDLGKLALTYGDDAGKLLLSSTDDAVRALASSSDDALRVIGRNVVDDMVDDWYGAGVNNADSAAGNWDEDISNALAEDAGKGYNGSAGAGDVIKTPYGDALQLNSEESLALKKYVDNGGNLYRGGNLGRSYVADGQFWAPESPLNPGYADKYGVDFNNLDFIVRGKQINGSPYITRPSPGLHIKPGGALEVVNDPYSVMLDYFYML